MQASRRSGARRGALLGLAAAALVVLGVGVGFFFARAGRDPVVRPNAAEVRLPSAPPAGSPSPATSSTTEPAPTPRAAGAAIMAFLEAEQSAAFARSFALLTPSDRRELGPLPAWQNLHADLPVLQGFTVGRVEPAGDGRARAHTMLRLRAQLDEFIGLIPGRARGEWPLRRTADGWRVLFTRRRLEPVFPPAGQVVDDAAAWAGARQACEPAGWDGGMYGRSDLAEALCDAQGELRLGPPGPLEPGPETAELTAAFGEEVFEFSRVVPVRAPVRLRAVLAPIGDRWEVIAVLPP